MFSIALINDIFFFSCDIISPLAANYPHMQPDNNQVSRLSSSTLETIAFYVFVIVITLVPFIFWPSRLVTFELVKSTVIVLGSIISAILFLVVALKEKKLALPPKNIFWTGALIGLSLLISAFGLSSNFHIFSSHSEIRNILVSKSRSSNHMAF